MKIFISYRRDDSAGHAGRLFDHLTANFGVKSVFMDVDTIQPGQDFRKAVSDAVRACDVVLVMIGKHWLGITDTQGRRRLDDPRDLVRVEVATALANPKTLIIPVLIRGAGMPGEQDLPDDLKELTWRNAMELSDSRFQHDASKLVGVIERSTARTGKSLLIGRQKRNVMRGLGVVLGLILLGFIVWGLNGVLGAVRFSGVATSTDMPAATDVPTIDRTAAVLTYVAESPTTIDRTAAAVQTSLAEPTATSTRTATSTLTPTDLPTLTSTPVIVSPRGIPMVLISAGFFDMYGVSGSSKIYVNEFYVDQYEVTNGEYKKCVEANACSKPFTNAADQYDHVVHYGDPPYRNFPVVMISWNSAQNFCRWRGSDTRLPTDVEWEKAARGLLVSQSYPWGDNPPVCSTGILNGSNFSDCGTMDVIPVGNYSPNGYGIYDMAGNAAEWVDKDTTGNQKIIRGGSFLESASGLRVYSNLVGNILEGYVNVGFRCVKEVP